MRDGIIKRGRTWSYVVREPDPATGRTRPRWVGGFPTRKAAQAARDAARHALNRGTYVAPQELTVAAYLDQWLEAHANQVKPSTLRSYQEKVDLYLKPSLGSLRLQALSPSRLSPVWRELYASGGRGGTGLSVRTVEFARAVLRRALNDAVVDRLLEVNPVLGSKLPKRDGKPQHKTWTGEQVSSFLGAVAETRWAPLWELAAGTGMRRGELMGLRWTDIDLDEAIVAVDRSTTQIGKDRVTTSPKNHERRRVAIDPHLVLVLRSWRKQQAEERLAWGEAYEHTEGWVFTWESGRPLLPDYVTKNWIKAQQASGLPRLTLHELRHTHATILLRAGTPVHIVSKRLGHKDPSVTLNVYADVIPEDDQSAVQIFSQAVWGGAS
ncbi:site-specific integrase [Nocardioides euryhalodurans]|uniref:Site-specific integrase n=2 Tax=Nocardioides euryhalodurans TaxID=2518370 RepID=A0A4P7GQS0_9ACTN|nr:site-specific integrase [Nocardioides euryhalodurans]